MLAFAETLTMLHGLVRWLAIAAASWMLALALVMLVRRRGLGALERRSLTALTGSLHGQVGLGVIIALLLNGSGAPPFEGRVATLVGHALGGVLMAACATLATVMTRRAASHRAQGLWLAVCTGLGWLLLGKWAVSIPLLIVSVIVVLLVTRLAHRPTPSPVATDPVQNSEN